MTLYKVGITYNDDGTKTFDNGGAQVVCEESMEAILHCLLCAVIEGGGPFGSHVVPMVHSLPDRFDGLEISQNEEDQRVVFFYVQGPLGASAWPL